MKISVDFRASHRRSSAAELARAIETIGYDDRPCWITTMGYKTDMGGTDLFVADADLSPSPSLRCGGH
jgi:hypothetical protein